MNIQRNNEDELRARSWLIQQGYKDILRPASDPPDFVVEGIHAIEVTRLNQRIIIGDEGYSVGEEEARIPLKQHLENTVRKLGPPGNVGRSWLIDCEYDFTKPLPDPKQVTSQVSQALAPLLRPYDRDIVSTMVREHFNFEKHAGEISFLSSTHLCLDCGICLELNEFSHSPSCFFIQNVSDGIGIGVAAELNKGIQHSVVEKSRKIRNHEKVEAHESWWLILVDYICYSLIQNLSGHEKLIFRNQEFDFWSRIVIVSSLDPMWHYDLRPR